MRGIIRILQSLGGGGGQPVNFFLTQTKSFDLTPSQVINNKRSQTKKRKNIRRIEELRSRRVQWLTLPSPLPVFTLGEPLTIVLASVLAKFSKPLK